MAGVALRSLFYRRSSTPTCVVEERHYRGAVLVLPQLGSMHPKGPARLRKIELIRAQRGTKVVCYYDSIVKRRTRGGMTPVTVEELV